MMLSLSLLPATTLLGGLFLYYIHRRLRRERTIDHLPGPPSRSWLAGNLPELFRPKEMGDADFLWTREYGNLLCIKGVFGENVLFISDPKGLQYILNTAGYRFGKTPENRATIALTIGRGILWADGSTHARHRKVLYPAFSHNSLKGFFPLFRNTAQKTVVKLTEHLQGLDTKSAAVNIFPWLARTTLDSIGLAAFGCDFGAVDEGPDNKLAKAYHNLFVEVFHARSDLSIASEILWGMVPEWLFHILERFPTKALKRLKDYMGTVRGIAKSLLISQAFVHSLEKDSPKDVMSLLVKANMSEDPKLRLDEEEVLSELTTLFIAGHETTSATIAWMLYELSRHPEYQVKIREEIETARANALQRGDEDITIMDLESMKLLLAVIKETLRYHPIAPFLPRLAKTEDVIPLSTPQKTRSGELISHLAVNKGQRIHISLGAYNRLKSVWGEDAHLWRPERFLENVHENQKVRLGVIANIASFGSGMRNCIGWKFAMIEMQAIMIEFLDHFDFSPPPGNVQVIRGAVNVMTPMVKDSKTPGTELPLTVTVLSS